MIYILPIRQTALPYYIGWEGAQRAAYNRRSQRLGMLDVAAVECHSPAQML